MPGGRPKGSTKTEMRRRRGKAMSDAYSRRLFATSDISAYLEQAMNTELEKGRSWKPDGLDPEFREQLRMGALERLGTCEDDQSIAYYKDEIRKGIETARRAYWESRKKTSDVYGNVVPLDLREDLTPDKRVSSHDR